MPRWPDFSLRSPELELMDDLEIQGPELERTLDEIARINTLLGGYAPSLGGLAALADDAAEISVLDVGTGSADTPRKMVQWGRARGKRVKVFAIDLADTTVEYARKLCREFPEIQVEKIDLFELDEGRMFDVVHAAAVLHHFPETATPAAVKKMAAHAKRGVVINDIHRHAFAWGGIKVLTSVFSKSRLVRNDAALSVLRAFSRKDWFSICAAAGVAAPSVSWVPMFRWQVVLRTDSPTGARSR